MSTLASLNRQLLPSQPQCKRFMLLPKVVIIFSSLLYTVVSNLFWLPIPHLPPCNLLPHPLPLEKKSLHTAGRLWAVHKIYWAKLLSWCIAWAGPEGWLTGRTVGILYHQWRRQGREGERRRRRRRRLWRMAKCRMQDQTTKSKLMHTNKNRNFFYSVWLKYTL